MADIRRLLQDGDPTSGGGVLIGSSDSTNIGKRLALEGDYATCAKCKAGGAVYNDCNPRWTDMGKSVLVEGARVHCRCGEKPVVIPTQNEMTTEVGIGESGSGDAASVNATATPMPAHAMSLSGNAKRVATAETRQTTVLFSGLWAAYPAGTPYVDANTGKPPPGFENQCAIRLSVALHRVGVGMDSFRGKGQIRLDGKRTAVLAEELSDWLRRNSISGVGSPETITGADWQKKIRRRRGIVAFRNYWMRDGQTHPTGGHIDLWNGYRLTGGGVYPVLINFARFFFEVSSSLWHSDLGKATEIVFWEIH